MIVRIDPSSSLPAFEQIVQEVKAAIAAGACRPGEMIPSVRRMAAQALVNPNTVAKAYRELEREGVVHARRGLGLVVAAGAEANCRDDRLRSVREDLARVVAEAQRAGISEGDLLAALNEALAEQADAGRRTMENGS